MVARFAPVLSLNGYHALGNQVDVVGYHLLIASEVLKNRSAWSYLFRSEGPLDVKGRFVVMDNGVIELGESVPIKDLAEAAEIVGADAVVVPDKIDDKNETLSRAARSVHQLARSFHRKVLLLGVAQGVTVDEVVACGQALAMMGCEIISAPRGLTKNLGSRIDVTIELHKRVRKPIHLLGFSDDIADDITTAGLPGVIGIDSAMPIYAAMFDKAMPSVALGDQYLNQLGRELGPRPLAYWDMNPDADEVQLILTNIMRVNEWLSYSAVSGALTVRRAWAQKVP